VRNKNLIMIIVEIGTFTDTLMIRDIDYFRVADLSVSRL